MNPIICKTWRQAVDISRNHEDETFSVTVGGVVQVIDRAELERLYRSGVEFAHVCEAFDRDGNLHVVTVPTGGKRS